MPATQLTSQQALCTSHLHLQLTVSLSLAIINHAPTTESWSGDPSVFVYVFQLHGAQTKNICVWTSNTPSVAAGSTCAISEQKLLEKIKMPDLSDDIILIINYYWVVSLGTWCISWVTSWFYSWLPGWTPLLHKGWVKNEDSEEATPRPNSTVVLSILQA